MSFSENLTNFRDNCLANPFIPVMLGACTFASIYIPATHMPVKSVALALAAVATIDKVKAVAWILCCGYVLTGSLIMLTAVVLRDNTEHVNEIDEHGIIKQTIYAFTNVFLIPIVAIYNGINSTFS